MTASTENKNEPWLWDQGHYESTGEALHGYAQRVVERAAPTRGERALDIGTGTGNAALLLAERGASTTGLDLATRLLGVARERSRAAGLDVSWVVGNAQEMPFLDDEFDVAVSVSALVLVPGARRSAEELVRVLRPGGRAVIGGWDREAGGFFPGEDGFELHLPGRPDLPDLTSVLERYAGMGGPMNDRPGWFSESDVHELFAGLDVEVEVHREELELGSAPSLDSLSEQFGSHPVSQGIRAGLDDAAYDVLQEQLATNLADVVVPARDGGLTVRQTALVTQIRKG